MKKGIVPKKERTFVAFTRVGFNRIISQGSVLYRITKIVKAKTFKADDKIERRVEEYYRCQGSKEDQETKKMIKCPFSGKLSYLIGIIPLKFEVIRQHSDHSSVTINQYKKNKFTKTIKKTNSNQKLRYHQQKHKHKQQKDKEDDDKDNDHNENNLILTITNTSINSKNSSDMSDNNFSFCEKSCEMSLSEQQSHLQRDDDYESENKSDTKTKTNNSNEEKATKQEMEIEMEEEIIDINQCAIPIQDLTDNNEYLFNTDKILNRKRKRSTNSFN